jgi:hypothetical protein
MSRELAEASGQDAEPDASLGSIAESDSGISQLAHWLTFGTGVRHLEQEALEPRSPLVDIQRSASPKVQTTASERDDAGLEVMPAPPDLEASGA